jgi:hypothetical protein
VKFKIRRKVLTIMAWHGGFLGRVFQKDRNKKTNDVVFLGTLGTFQNGILENILYGAFREMAHSDHFFITVTVQPFSADFFTNNTNFWSIVTKNRPKNSFGHIPSPNMGQKFSFSTKNFFLQNNFFCYFWLIFNSFWHIS